MAKVEYLDNTFVFPDLVVDENRAVKKLTYARPLSDGATHARKTKQQLHMGKQRIAETRSGFGIILSNVTNDCSEVV